MIFVKMFIVLVFKMNPKFYIGIGSIINRAGLSLFFMDLETKEKINIDGIMETINTGKIGNLSQHEYQLKYRNWLLYETKHSYHLLSLNAYKLNSIDNIIKMLKGNKVILCKKYLKFWDKKKSFTLRINKKLDEKRELLYYSSGLYPISKPHYILYCLIFPDIQENFYTQKYFDNGIKFEGYRHDFPKEDD